MLTHLLTNMQKHHVARNTTLPRQMHPGWKNHLGGSDGPARPERIGRPLPATSGAMH